MSMLAEFPKGKYQVWFSREGNTWVLHFATDDLGEAVRVQRDQNYGAASMITKRVEIEIREVEP